jgi:hypothetical protein
VIYQQDAEFPQAVHLWGCYLLSLCERLCNWTNTDFTHERVLEVLGWGQANGVIDQEVTLLSPQAICDHVAGVNKFRFFGKFSPSYPARDDEFEVVCYHKDGASFNHFCSGNGRGMVLYDPWSVDGSDSVRNGALIGKRIYRRWVA